MLPKEKAKTKPTFQISRNTGTEEKAEAKVQKHQNGWRLTAKFLLSEAATAKYRCLT
jgi:hypothetical protein